MTKTDPEDVFFGGWLLSTLFQFARVTVPGTPNCEFLTHFPDFLGNFKSRKLPRVRGLKIQDVLKV